MTTDSLPDKIAVTIKGRASDLATFDQPDIDKQIADIKMAYAMDIPHAIIALNNACRMLPEGEK